MERKKKTKPKKNNKGTTHSEECYKWHPECAVERIDRALGYISTVPNTCPSLEYYWIERILKGLA